MTFAATTFDPGSKGSNTTLSAGNLTAAMTASYGRASATRPCMGKTYWEIVVANTNTPRVGVCEPYNYYFNPTNALGADTAGFGYDPGGVVYFNSASQKTIATYGAGANIGVAYDPVAQLLWFRVNGGNWNNTAIGSEDPASALGGISGSPALNYSGAGGAASFFPAVSGGNGSSFNALFTSGSWVYAAPSGFGAIGSSLAAACNPKPARNNAATASALTPVVSCRNPASKRGGKAFTAGNTCSPAGAAVAISGNVQEAGANVARTVLVYDNTTGELLEKVTSDASTGNFSALCHARSKVFAVSLDPTTYQALIFDRISPA